MPALRVMQEYWSFSHQSEATLGDQRHADGDRGHWNVLVSGDIIVYAETLNELQKQNELKQNTSLGLNWVQQGHRIQDKYTLKK